MNIIVIILIILLGFVLLMLLMLGIDNLTTYLHVKHLTLENIEHHIKHYNDVIKTMQSKNESISKIDLVLDEKERWEYYLQIKLKQLNK